MYSLLNHDFQIQTARMRATAEQTNRPPTKGEIYRAITKLILLYKINIGLDEDLAKAASDLYSIDVFINPRTEKSKTLTAAWLFNIGWQWQRVPLVRNEAAILIGSDPIRRLSLSRAGSGCALLFEENNFNLIADRIVFDGDYFSFSSTPAQKWTIPAIQCTESRAFDSGGPIHDFNFDGDDDWDVQKLTFRQTANAANMLKEKELLRMCKAARPMETAYEATFVYSVQLKNNAPKTFDFLRTTGFYNVCRNAPEYIKQCKLFTTTIKRNFSALQEKGIEPTLLFELEQLAGFRTADKEPDWKTNILDWISNKNNCSSAVTVYIAQQKLRHTLKDLLSPDTMKLILQDASTFNSSGSAKGKKMKFGKGELAKIDALSGGEEKTSSSFRLSKTAFNLTADWEERERLLKSVAHWTTYPIPKKEVTKVRYIINTDLESHYQLSPVEKVLLKMVSGENVFNQMPLTDQNMIKRSWLTTADTLVSIDQSSFDHNCSRHLFRTLFDVMEEKIKTGEDMSWLHNAKEKFENARIIVQGEKQRVRWMSGMLSGFKITNIGDSLFNLVQTTVAAEISNTRLNGLWVNGDDTMATIDKGTWPDTLLAALNDMGLDAHPDKTITSTNYCEFLRLLYSKKDKSITGYATRMVPSLVYAKPWVGVLDTANLDADEATGRLVNWRKLARRFSDDSVTSVFAALDISAALRDRSMIKDIMENFDSKNLVTKSSSRRKTPTKYDRFLTKPPLEDKSRYKNANLTRLDLQRWLLANKKTVEKKKLVLVSSAQPEGVATVKEYASMHEFKQLPFPVTWSNKLLKKLGPKCYDRYTTFFGMKREGLEQWWLNKSREIAAKPDNSLDRQQWITQMKTNVIVMPNIDEALVPKIKDKMILSAVYNATDFEEARGIYTKLVSETDFAQAFSRSIELDVTVRN